MLILKILIDLIIVVGLFFALAGTKGILINRTTEDKDFGQDHTINDLSGLLSLL